jgi:hypothetical protein
LVIKPSHIIPLPQAASPPPTGGFPTPTLILSEEYVKTYAKCGETPLLPLYYSPSSTPKLWSPDCRFITWSDGSRQYVYDLSTQKVSQSTSP